MNIIILQFQIINVHSIILFQNLLIIETLIKMYIFLYSSLFLFINIEHKKIQKIKIFQKNYHFLFLYSIYSVIMEMFI